MKTFSESQFKGTPAQRDYAASLANKAYQQKFYALESLKTWREKREGTEALTDELKARSDKNIADAQTKLAEIESFIESSKKAKDVIEAFKNNSFSVM